MKNLMIIAAVGLLLLSVPVSADQGETSPPCLERCDSGGTEWICLGDEDPRVVQAPDEGAREEGGCWVESEQGDDPVADIERTYLTGVGEPQSIGMACSTRPTTSADGDLLSQIFDSTAQDAEAQMPGDCQQCPSCAYGPDCCGCDTGCSCCWPDCNGTGLWTCVHDGAMFYGCVESGGSCRCGTYTCILGPYCEPL